MKPNMLRKLLLVAREDGTGAYNLLIEFEERTLTKQIPSELCDGYLNEIAKTTLGFFTKHGLGNSSSESHNIKVRAQSLKDRYTPTYRG